MDADFTYNTYDNKKLYNSVAGSEYDDYIDL